ncbi:MAG: heme o synthase [Anaerolineae bacterium]|nr:heme o synthase [Anaerolineae bacterium]MDW8173137.1 heme o synthase [Anaerolineae bacterium]
MESAIRSTSTILSTLCAYSGLMKWRIVALLVFTTVTAMIVAANDLPNVQALLWTIVAGTMAAGGASALNQYIDRDLDALMARTARRPIPSGRVQPINALLFGLALVAWAVLLFGVFVNWLAASLALIGALYYVVLYTLVLKRNTTVNIVIGGGAGAIPVLVGWAAATGTLALEAFILFAIVFYWTPPHSWALAILVNKDYAAANVPMMPVARGEDVTRLQILLYSVQLVLITLMPGLGLLVPGEDMLGLFYLASALLLGGGLIYVAWRLIQLADKAMARNTYKYSSMYLALLFLAMILDRLIS